MMKPMPKLAKKLILSFFASLCLLSSSISSIHAQGAWYDQSFTEWATKVSDDGTQEVFGERFTYFQVNGVMQSIGLHVAGIQTTRCAKPIIAGDSAQFGGCVNGLTTANSGSGPLIGLAYLGDNLMKTKPASGIQYVADAAARFHIIPEAQAQGFGFQTLSPVQNLWRATRNMAYLLSIIVFIGMAFMIMFRVKISPQAIITVQSAIPKIAIALILITFSYAIAGFIIDLSFVVLGLMSILIKSVGNDVSSLSAIDLFTKLNTGNAWGALIVPITLVLLLPSLVVGGAGTVLIPGAGAVLGIIVLLIGLVFLLIVFLRMFWLMIKTTINILLLIIAAPFIILFGTLPGGPGFGTWIKSLIANVAVFPVIQIMFFLAHFFLWGFFSWDPAASILTDSSGLFNIFGINIEAVSGQVIFLPNFIFGRNIETFVGLALVVTVLSLIPKTAEVVKALIEGKGINYGAALGEAIGPIRTLGLGAAQLRASSMEEKQQMAFFQQYPQAKKAPPIPGIEALRRMGLLR